MTLIDLPEMQTLWCKLERVDIRLVGGAKSEALHNQSGQRRCGGDQVSELRFDEPDQK